MCYNCRASRELDHEFCSICGKHLHPLNLREIESLNDAVDLPKMITSCNKLLNYSKKFLSLKKLIASEKLTFSTKEPGLWYWSDTKGLDDKVIKLGDMFIKYQELCFNKTLELLELDGWKWLKDKDRTYKKDKQEVILLKLRNPLFYVVKLLSK